MVEIQEFGLNAVTVGFLGTIIFTLVQAWGLRQQSVTIWKRRSGASVSVTYFAYSTAHFTTTMIYGVSQDSIALIFNGLLLAVMLVPIIFGLWKFKRWSLLEKGLVACFLTFPVIVAVAPAKDWLFLLFSFGTLASCATQPLEIWRNKDSGAVEIRFVLTFLASTIFWLIYGFAIGDWVLEIIIPGFVSIHVATLVLWYRYRPTKA